MTNSCQITAFKIVQSRNKVRNVAAVPINRVEPDWFLFINQTGSQASRQIKQNHGITAAVIPKAGEYMPILVGKRNRIAKMDIEDSQQATHRTIPNQMQYATIFMAAFAIFFGCVDMA